MCVTWFFLVLSEKQNVLDIELEHAYLYTHAFQKAGFQDCKTLLPCALFITWPKKKSQKNCVYGFIHISVKTICTIQNASPVKSQRPELWPTSPLRASIMHPIWKPWVAMSFLLLFIHCTLCFHLKGLAMNFCAKQKKYAKHFMNTCQMHQ